MEDKYPQHPLLSQDLKDKALNLQVLVCLKLYWHDDVVFVYTFLVKDTISTKLFEVQKQVLDLYTG